MTSTTILDIEKICRVCLQGNLEMKLIFECQENPTIAQMLSELTIYKVQSLDDLPHLVCLDCLNKVLEAYKLKQQCEKSYRTLMAIIYNDSGHNSPMKQVEKHTQTEETSMYPCERCQEKFFTYDALRFHRQNEHKGTPVVCRFCSRSFDSIVNLKSHMAVFHPDSGYISHYQCQICKRQFTRREHKTRHLRVVHHVTNDDLEASKEEQEETSEDKKPTNIKAVKSEKEFYDLLHLETLTEDEDERPLADLINNTTTIEGNEVEKPMADLLDNTALTSQIIEDALNETLMEDVITEELYPQEPEETANQNDNILEDTVQTPKRSRGRPPKKPPNCKYCGKSFNDSFILKQHIEEAHIKAQYFPCKICSNPFSNQNDLENHFSTNHKEETQIINCDQCSKSFNYPSHYKRHKESHANKLHQCCKCEKSFSSKNFLQKHLENHDKKRYVCKECAQDFPTREELNNHTKLEGHDRPLLCPECGLRCKTTNILTVHMRRHNGEKPFKCKFCSKGFPRMDDLRIHEKYHTGEKSHFCETCGKGFLRKYNLRIHLRVHTGEKPYKCPHCPQAFAQGNDLKAHIRRHTGERFRCEICGAAFLQAYQIRQHRLQEHGIHEIPPTQRVKKFTSPEEQEKQIQQNLQREMEKTLEPGDSKKECAATN